MHATPFISSYIKGAKACYQYYPMQKNHAENLTILTIVLLIILHFSFGKILSVNECLLKH